MCEVISVISAAVSAVAAIAGTATSVVSGIQSANEAQAQYNYQAELDKRNAKLAQNQAESVKQQGIEEARMQRIRTLQKVGAQHAQMAASGIDASQGTALDIIQDTATMGELEANTIRYKYDNASDNYQNQANDYLNQSLFDKTKAKTSYQRGMTNTAISGMNGLSAAMDKTDSFAKKYNAYKNPTTNANPTTNQNT